MIYDKNGDLIATAYKSDGTQATAAYTVQGTQIYPNNIKVMTYNVGGWYDGRGTNVPVAKKDEYYALQTGMIINDNPDILVIQEYLGQFCDDGTSALDMLRSLFPYVHVKESGTYFGRAICSKYPISNYEENTFTAESSRYYDSCTVTVGNMPITVINTHLGVTQTNRTSEIAEILTFLESQEQPFLLCGDFNTMIATQSTEATEYIDNVKPFLDAGLSTANFGGVDWYLSCINNDLETEYYLDNVYTESPLTIVSAYLDETKLDDGISDIIDHMPLIVTVKII